MSAHEKKDVNYQENVLESIAGKKQLKTKIKEYLSNSKIEEEERNSFRTNLNIETYHDKILDVCASAFGPESELSKIGYQFVSCEPLVELGVKNFDVFIYSKNLKHAIFVECKTSSSSRSKIISDAYEAKKEILKNKAYLEQKIGDEIRSFEFVLCVPAEDIEYLVQGVENRENRKLIDEENDGLLLIWQVNMFHQASISLFTRINSRNERIKSQHLDPNLTRTLSKGHKLNSEVMSKFYPSSHSLKKNKHIITNILRINKNSNSDIQFDDESIILFCTSPSTLVHYAANEIGIEIAARFIRENEKYGLISKVDDKGNSFKLKVRGKQISTIIKNYEEDYENAFIAEKIKRRAEKEVMEDYHRSQKTLFDF